VALGKDRLQDLAGALHEVSNALTVVLGWLDVARSKLPPGPEREALEIARTHARLGYGVARQAIGAEVHDSSNGQSTARAVARAAITGVTPEAARCGVELVLDVGQSHAFISSSGVALQILTNLLFNAIAFTPPGRCVFLSVREQGLNVVFTVHDEGPGIAPERLDSLFEGPVSTRRGGAGVGLKHSHALAAEHGGSLSVSPFGSARSAVARSAARTAIAGMASIGGSSDVGASAGTHGSPDLDCIDCASVEEDGVESGVSGAGIEGPGGGAAFDLAWPIVEARSSTGPQRSIGASVRGARVLVVEDDAAVRSLIELALEARGAETVLVGSAPELDLALVRGCYDVALIDLSPIADQAPRVFARLRETNPEIATILISGLASGVPETIEREVAAWVRKPFEMGEVLDVMARLLNLNARSAPRSAEFAAG
jgi:signal transduction histidine kinase/ActR/RegA family two-component response regulator